MTATERASERTITLDVAHPPLAFTYTFCRPQVHVNGQQVAAGWGRHVITAPVGADVSVHVPYLGMRAGQARATVAPETTTWQYRAPYVVTMGGELGPFARSRGGVLAAALVAPAVVVAVAVIWAILATADADPSDLGPAGGPTGQGAGSLEPGDAAQVYRLEPTGQAGPELLAGTAVYLSERLAPHGAVVEVDGGALTVAFDAPPTPQALDLVTAPSVVELRQVVVVWAPGTVDPADLASLGPGLPDLAAAVDCTDAGMSAQDEENLIGCSRERDAVYLLGPAEITTSAFASVTVGPLTTDSGAITNDVVADFELDAVGTQALQALSERAVAAAPPGDQLALVVDSVIWAAPRIGEVLPNGQFQLSGEGASSAGAAVAYGHDGGTRWQLIAPGSGAAEPGEANLDGGHEEAVCAILSPDQVSALLARTPPPEPNGLVLDTRRLSQSVSYQCYFMEGATSVLRVEVLAATTPEAAAIIDQVLSPGVDLVEVTTVGQATVTLSDASRLSGDQKVRLRARLDDTRALGVDVELPPDRAAAAFEWLQDNADQVIAAARASATMP